MRTLALLLVGLAVAGWALLLPSRRDAGRVSRRRAEAEAALILAAMVALYAAR